ncbi:MAG: NADH:flavin oxidoreductase [Marinifilaceae bacterium]|jgi:2,4-dienoyl-CoA reductase-like NADH-dependent reductase (Old Yellow Enzyme family)|nr:NADH:flavin oxidoreductase [Marinifilaceae bacterium]
MNIFNQTNFANLSLKNRLWRSATWLGMADNQGYVTDRVKEEYRKLSKGGVGNIIVEFTNILEEEKTYPGILSLATDKHILGMSELAKIIHENNTNAFVQIGYGGSTTSMPIEGREILGPSAVPNISTGIVPKEMNEADIKKIVNGMAEAALRAKNANFDGVEIHAAHGYLFSQFLSPYFNQRTDNYGGSITNRGRIILESLDAMRKKVGSQYPILIKMHCDDQWGDKGLSVEDSIKLAKELEKRGITAIEFSGGNIDNQTGNSPLKPKLHKIEDQSYFKDEVRKIAEELSVPVILVGGNRNVELMNHILNNSKIQYFALSRTLLSEPDLPNKWMENPEKKPRCVSCNNCWAEGGNNCIIDRKKRA